MQKNSLFLILVGWCAFLLGILVLPTTTAAIMLGMSTDQLTDDSSLVVVGKIVDSRAAFHKDTIVTTLTVEVSQALKGSFEKKMIHVDYEGGKVDNIGLLVSDTKIPPVGERVVLFLAPKSPNGEDSGYRVVGKAQGQYRIDENNMLHKDGFSVVGGQNMLDTEIPLEVLIEKVRKKAP